MFRSTRAIFAREVGAIFDSKIAYVYAIAFALLANSIFMNEFFLVGLADMTPFFETLPLLLCVFLPAVTMRSFAEESKTRTIELLLTLPIRPLQAVLAKFGAALVLYAVFLACTLPIPFLLFRLGDPDAGRLLGGYLGAFGLGSVILALGLFVSALTSDQIVAFVLTSLVAFALVLVGNERVAAILDGLAENFSAGTFLLERVSLLPPFEAFVRGILELSSVAYLGGATLLFLLGAAFHLERKRG